MGQFQHRPEEPTEWGGLPSEPWESRDSVEQLEQAPTADALWTLVTPSQSIAVTPAPADSPDATPSDDTPSDDTL